MYNAYYQKESAKNKSLVCSKNYCKPTPTYNQLFEKKSIQKSYQRFSNAYNTDIISYGNQQQLYTKPKSNQSSDSSFPVYNPIIAGRYQKVSQQIEEHILNENQNLKEQVQFLTNQVKKANKKSSQYKLALKQTKQNVIKLQHERDVYKLQYIQIKQYVFNFMDSLEKYNPQLKNHFIVSMDQNLQENFYKKNSPQQYYRTPPRNIQVIQSSKLPSKQDNRVTPSTIQTIDRQQTNQHSQIINQHRQVQSEQQSINNNQNICQLNNQFQALMYEFKTKKDPEIRKKCIQIAKQIQKLKRNDQSYEGSKTVGQARNWSSTQKCSKSFNTYDNDDTQLVMKKLRNTGGGANDTNILKYLPQSSFGSR